MRLNGASKPHGAFQYDGGSIGATNHNYMNCNENSNNTNSLSLKSRIYNSTKPNSSKPIQFNNNNSSQLSRNNLLINSSRVRNNGSNPKMIRIEQSTISYLTFAIGIFYIFGIFPCLVNCDENENGFFINGIETTTPEFDFASRGEKKFGDKCESTLECGFAGSVCDSKKKSCQCTEDLPITNHIDKCGKSAIVNDTCHFNEQCEAYHPRTMCRDGRCACLFDMSPFLNKDGIMECKERPETRPPEHYVDPTMIMILVAMALMFVIICVVLRLFSRARWRENRTIFNTPNPRLMNVSLLRENKLLHGQERRGSRMSVRVPSRQPSMASLRPHSPNPSLGSRRESRGSSNASGTSIRSNRSNSGVTYGNHEMKHSPHHYHNTAHEPLVNTNITTNPAAENVAVEIVEPEK